MLLRVNKISRVRIHAVETCANAPEMIPEAMAAVIENMKKATCAGELATHRSNSYSSRAILRPEYPVFSTAAKTAAIKAASGRNAERNCSINLTFPVLVGYNLLYPQYYHYNIVETQQK